MHAALDITHAFFGWLWRASWQASVVIILVLLAQWLLRNRLPPRWRHALWLLVLVRLFLPATIATPISVFNWFTPKSRPAISSSDQPVPEPAIAALQEGATDITLAAKRSWRIGAPVLWLGGCVALAGWLLAGTCRLHWKISRERPVTRGEVLDLLEDCKQAMGVHTPLTLVETSAVKSPSLFGFIRPRLLLPAGLTSSFSLPELRYVFLHELGHVKRGDIPLNWLLAVPLVLHWFNPLVWFAVSRMRVDGELACDALALSHAQDSEKLSYGQTIIKLLERFSRPAVAPGLLGILENQNQMKRRIHMIKTFSRTSPWTALGVAAFGVLALVTLTDAQTAQGNNGSAPVVINGPPRIVSTTPAMGATEVDPGLTEITVTFDRDMGGGFSWTGGGPDYPPIAEGKKPQWKDKRTCVLPVKLQAAHYYRVGINSTSYQNFRSTDGVPARPSAVYFATKGASEEIKRKVGKPVLVAMTPVNGAKDVDPNLTELRVTFNVPMGGGFSWTGGGPQYPAIPEGKKPFWTEDRKTCVLPVRLEPGKEYRLGLNSPSHKNFQSQGGVPLDPVSYTFRTRQ